MPYAAVSSLVETICSQPPEQARPQLAPIVTYLGEGHDPELLDAAVDLICHCERSRLLAHLAHLIGWLETTGAHPGNVFLKLCCTTLPLMHEQLR